MNRFLSFYYRRIKPSFLQKPLGAASEAPFFILSAGRSGSTLLRKWMLMNAPVNIPPESDDLIPKLIKFFIRYNHKSWEYIVRNCADIYNKEAATSYWRAPLGEEEIKQLLSVRTKEQSLAGVIQFMYDHYARVHHLESKSWGDKTPFLIFRLPWINMLHPEAKCIFLIRDGRAVVNSFLKMNTGYTVENAADRWLKALASMEEQQRKSGKDKIHLIRYEELVTNTEIELKKIYDFLRLTPYKEPKNNLFLGDDVLPHHQNVQSEINPGNIDKWKRELSESQIRRITEKMGGRLKDLGYL